MVNTLSNILNNAVAAHPSYISLKLSTKNEFAVIEVKDNGEGIADQNKPQIYEPFFTTKQKNLGLGLTNAQKSIINHNGKIEFQSEENVGTTFLIYLPISNQSNAW